MLIATASREGDALDREAAPFLRVSEVLSALSFALDLTEGQPAGHSLRSCVLGMRIAKELGLPGDMQADLYYALLMKDAGCSSNASRMFQLLGTDEIKAKRDVKTTDWTRTGWETLQYAISHVKTTAPFFERVRGLLEVAANQKRNAKDLVQIRCERGADIARRIGLSEASATAIYSLDEQWSGEGQPKGLRGRDIPLLSRIMSLAQTAEVFFTTQGKAAAIQIARKRSGRWFDPDVVQAFQSIARKKELWLEVGDAAERAVELEPEQLRLSADDTTIDQICTAFADVIDAKSPFTYRHSAGVASTAVSMARTLGLAEQDVKLIRRSALLHDIGKLGISNAILEKPDPLSVQEWSAIHQHPSLSAAILKRVPGFGALSEIVACHHEKLDGSGYFRGLEGGELTTASRILVVAEMFDALVTRRPYRDALTLEQALTLLEADAPGKLDADCVQALKHPASCTRSVDSLERSQEALASTRILNK